MLFACHDDSYLSCFFPLCFGGILTLYNRICIPFTLFLYSIRHLFVCLSRAFKILFKVQSMSQRISITWKLLRNTESQAHWVRICSLTWSPGDLCAHCKEALSLSTKLHMDITGPCNMNSQYGTLELLWLHFLNERKKFYPKYCVNLKSYVDVGKLTSLKCLFNK